MTECFCKWWHRNHKPKPPAPGPAEGPTEPGDIESGEAPTRTTSSISLLGAVEDGLDAVGLGVVSNVVLGASSPRSREGSPSASPRAAPPEPLDPHAQREAEKKALQRKLAKIHTQMQRNGKKIEYELETDFFRRICESAKHL